jgi:hypothetical protein
MPPSSRTTTNYAPRKGSPARQVIKSKSQSPTVMGFTRSNTSTTLNGAPYSSSSTVSHSGGGGGIVGPVLIIGGVFLLWIVFRGKSGAMWNAITGDTGFSANLDSFANAIGPLGGSSSGGGSSGGGGGSSSSVTGNASDSGTHMGIDSEGNIVTINKSYGSMSDSEKDAANNYAHQIGNV